MSAIRIFLTLCAAWIWSESGQPVFGQFFGSPGPSIAIQVPYDGPETVESQAMRLQTRQMQRELDYMRTMSQWQAAMAQQQWQEQQMWEAEQQAAEATYYPPNWNVAPQQPSRPMPFRFVNQSSFQQPRNVFRGRQTRITLRPVRDQSGNLYFQVLSIIEEEIPDSRP